VRVIFITLIWICFAVFGSTLTIAEDEKNLLIVCIIGLLLGFGLSIVEFIIILKEQSKNDLR